MIVLAARWLELPRVFALTFAVAPVVYILLIRLEAAPDLTREANIGELGDDALASFAGGALLVAWAQLGPGTTRRRMRGS